VISPASGSKPFYILQTGSSGEAIHLRTKEWKLFKNENLFITDDLTRIEQANVLEITRMLKAYFNVQFIPSTMFSRDKYKATLDGDTTKVHLLDRDEVERYIATKRINIPPPKNSTGGTS
jgi:hypothetical protein